MSNMSYCRHENTEGDLRDVWERWDDFDYRGSNGFEARSRIDLARLVKEMAEHIDLPYEERQYAKTHGADG